MGRLLELQSELKHSRTIASNTQAHNDHLSILLQELREVQWSLSFLPVPCHKCIQLHIFPWLSQQSHEMLELQRSRMQEEIREYKFRESRLLQDYTELEEENISLQKLVSTLKQSQVHAHNFINVSSIF